MVLHFTVLTDGFTLNIPLCYITHISIYFILQCKFFTFLLEHVESMLRNTEESFCYICTYYFPK